MNSPAPKRRGLLFFALAVLLLNAIGLVWLRYSVIRALEPERGAEAAEVAEEAGAAEPATVPLALERLSQASLSTNRILTLTCQFQGAVTWSTLGSRLTLYDGETTVPWQFVDTPQGNACQIRTLAPVGGDQLRAVLEPGVCSTDMRYSPSAVQIDRLLPVTPEFRFSEAGTTTPSFGQPEIRLEFTQDVDLRLAADCVTCEPPVAFTVAPFRYRWWSGFILRGDFAIGRNYTVTIAPQLRSVEGHALNREVRRTVFIGSRAPATRIAVPGRYLAPEGALIGPVLAVNTPEVVSSLAPVLPQNLVQLAMREAEQYSNWYSYGEDDREGDAAEELAGRAIMRTNRLATVRDQEQRLALRLRDHLPPEGAKGVFLLQIAAEKTMTQQRLVCLSDIGLAARREAEALQVWTTALRAGRAAPGCEVSLYGRNNALLDTAVTDEAGLARVAFDPANDQPFLLVAQNPADGDMTFLPLTDATEVESPVKTIRDYLAPAACEAYLFTERDLYRHGEKAFVQALLRQADGRAPAPFPTVLRVLKPDGRCFRTFPLMADAYGAAATEVTFPEYLPSGTYTLELALPGDKGTLLGRHAVMLEAFVPPQIRVSLRDLPATLRSGETLAGTLAAEHLFGKPAGGLAAEAQLLWQALPMKPAGWDDYAFGDPQRQSAPATLKAPRQRLDDEGRTGLALTLPSALRPAARLRAIVQGTVFEAGGRGVTARGEVTVDAYPFYLGVRPPAEAFARPGSRMDFRVAAVCPDGTRLDRSVAVTAVVEQVTWISNLRRTPEGRYEWSSETIRTPVGGGPLLLPAAEDGVYTLTAPNDGDYEITFTEPGSAAATRCAFTTGSRAPGSTPRDRSRPAHVELVFDKPVYQPGDVARVQIRAPFAGEAWITLQRDRIIESRVITLTGNTAEVTVEGAGERYQETLELAVRPAQAWRVTTEHARLAPGTAQSFKPPADVVPGTLRQVFTCAPRPTVNLLGALEYVTEYPYGCLEQTVSSVFPLLTLGRQAEPIVPPTSTLAQEAPDRIRAALTRILTMQRHDGFAPWPDAREADPFCSIYAAHFLVVAKAEGFPVGEQTLAEIHALLENLPYGMTLTLQAYAAMVQSLAGKPGFARMSRLLEQAPQLPSEARFLLGRALLRAGERGMGRELIEKTGLPGGLREAAFGTLAWLEIDPNAAQTAACCQTLQRQRRAIGHWGTTQDNALALLALGEYARHATSAPQPVAPCFAWDGGTFAAGPTNLVAWHTPPQAASLPLELTNAGTGPLYVSRRIEAVPLEESLPDVDNGLRVRRRWLTPEGEPIEMERLNRGDLVIVEIALETPEETGAPETIIEDLLPACLEIEHGEVARGKMFDWLEPDEADWVLHREVRDDRLLLFTRCTGERVCHYAARVVSAGEFTIPPIVASDMYVPERISRHGGGRVVVATP